MSKKRLARWVFGGVFLAVLAVPALAFGQEEAAAEAVAWQATAGKAIGAAIAMAVSAWSAGYAQSRIGAAGAGALAERPEVATQVIVLQALTEIIVLLGFVIAFMINA